MSFVKDLDRFIDYVRITRPSINRAAVDVTERYARKVLKVKGKEPLIYKGLSLSCRGSKRHRNANQLD